MYKFSRLEADKSLLLGNLPSSSLKIRFNPFSNIEKISNYFRSIIEGNDNLSSCISIKNYRGSLSAVSVVVISNLIKNEKIDRNRKTKIKNNLNQLSLCGIFSIDNTHKE